MSSDHRPSRLAAASASQPLATDDESSWTDEERDALRLESLESLGWEGMDAYQDDEP